MFFHCTYEAGSGLTKVMDPGCQELMTFDLGAIGVLELLGDPILRGGGIQAHQVTDQEGELDLDKLFTVIPGHYYWFLWKGSALDIGSSFCGIHPVYYRTVEGRVDICSSSFRLAQAVNAKADDRSYLLERALFNYPLFHRTPWKEISLLPAGCRLSVRELELNVVRAFAIERYFGEGSRSSRSDLGKLCDAFEMECDVHFPHKGFALSFTGGFDGRTLLAAALKLGRKDIRAFSFGLPGESDIELPKSQAGELGIDFDPVYLDDAYLRDHAFRSAIAFMELSDHNGNLGRPHYHYAAERTARSFDHMVTGNFGSELFRAMHSPGAMMSELLVRIFQSTDASWKDLVRQHAGKDLEEEVASLISDIEVHLNSSSDLSLSERFYRYVFDEVFRKYFGPEIVVQSKVLRNRTPFLSLRFIKVLHGTVWAGVHSRLHERNRIRRMKGQVFYAAFLQRAHRELYRMPTNKGYAPRDVIEAMRFPVLAWKIGMKHLKNGEEADSNAIGSFYRTYHQDLCMHFGLEELPEFLPAPNGDVFEHIQIMSNHVAWNAALLLNDRNGMKNVGTSASSRNE